MTSVRTLAVHPPAKLSRTKAGPKNDGTVQRTLPV